VSLANVLGAKATNEPVPFVHKDDLDLFNKYRDEGFEVQVGVHELLGHGTGKLLQETSPGVYNFDKDSPPLSPLTHEPVKTWYLPGQTWASVFGNIASSYEECRAECIAMALCPEPSILAIFGHGDGKSLDGAAGDVLYISYLTMARAGIAALEFWDPKSRKWGQAHMQARFSILRTFLSAKGPNGEKFAWLEHDEQGSGMEGDWKNLVVRLNRDLIPTAGRKAVETYLQKLHVYKSTANVDEGRKLYLDMTAVDEQFATKVRPAVLNAKTPRKVFVQVNTFEKDGKVEIKEYDATLEGMIQSWAERDV
jgi:dipeptidyl-peptidase-3